MNREQAKELLPIIQAFADGKEVQLKKTDGWVALKDPLWNLKPTNYRINQAREWTLEDKGEVGGVLLAYPLDDGKHTYKQDDGIKVREVLEGE